MNIPSKFYSKSANVQNTREFKCKNNLLLPKALSHPLQVKSRKRVINKKCKDVVSIKDYFPTI